MSRRLRLKPIFDERTGDPTRDAIARRDNKTHRRMARNVQISTPYGRQRKKYLHCVEGHRYMLVVNASARMAHEQRYGPGALQRPMGLEIDRPEMAPAPSPRGLLSR